MKKILLLLVVLITGCSLIKETPKGEVTKFLNNYKDNSTEVVNELNDYLKTEDLKEDALDDYRTAYLRQYSDLKYEIKDEKIDGDKATVEVAITVYDYYRTNMESNEYFTKNQDEFTDDGEIDFSKYMKYKIDKLVETKETVNYTLNLDLKKVKDSWEIEPLTNEQLSKLHGTYEY